MMMARSLLLLSWCNLLLLRDGIVAGASAASKQVVCPNDSSKMGYTSIRDMNDDIEQDFVSLGGDLLKQRDIYQYNLCPHTVFSSSQQQGEQQHLLPLLNNSHFYCHSNCTIEGNEIQVTLVDYPESNAAYVSFRGITFTGSTLYSIAAFGNKDKRADFYDCHWEDGVGASAIQIEYRDHGVVEESFTVDGGAPEVLYPFLPELKPWDGDDVHYMDMGDAEEDDKDNNGVADIFDLNRRRRRLVAGNHQGMTIRIYDSTFSNTNVDRYSAIYNSGSLFLKNVTMKNFNGAGVLINTVEGEATIEHSRFQSFQGISVIRAINSSGITVRDSTFASNEATGIITAVGSDDVVVSKCVFLDNFCPKGSEILVFWSTLECQDSCFVRSNSRYGPVYSSATSETSVTFAHGESIQGDHCGNDGMFVEDVGSTCFDTGADDSIISSTKSSSICAGRCEKFTAPVCAIPYVDNGSDAATAVIRVTAFVGALAFALLSS